MDVNTNSQRSDKVTERLATEIRQEQIAAAALSLIKEGGIESFSIAAIAKLLGLAPSAIYRHFSGKEQILLAVNRLITEKLLENIRIVCADSSDPVERLHRLLKLHVAFVQESDGVSRYVFYTGVSEYGCERKQQLFTGVRRYLEKVSELFSQAQECRQVQRDLDPDTLAFMFLGLIQPAIFLRQLGDGYYDFEAQTESAWEVFIAGVRRD
ncbi:transcriptional regulator, TetR family [Malonomonas rubra DSM 5091]|uniref:Transcriptional regulator, TetR family n=1 Tax=Malonomonas rubra DSM 5091 TaxID=1122189 RepID=A0A1M6NT89_MALRU|nr:TetR/AcrR family transcriptional regulator [Malonomonas rubra]SHJ98947.1 transcriptional regulator, TetR family [Malonomonas rubra DSM 5091]